MDTITQDRINRLIEAITPQGAATITETKLRHALEQIAQVAYTQGEINSLMGLLTIQDVAEHYGISERRARALAANRHEKFGAGMKVEGGWIFRPEELSGLAPDEKYRKK